MGCFGQDWASYQSPAPSVTGLSFVFVKATEGLTYANPRHDAQVAYARLYKLVVGHYHYPHMANSPTAEADRFLAVARPQAADLLCLDWEGYDAANRDVPMSRQVAYKNAFLDRVCGAMPLHQTGTYANGSYLAADPRGPYGDFLWIATAGLPAGKPGIARDWLFHQYGASGVDKDYCPLTALALRAWAHAKEDGMPSVDDIWNHTETNKASGKPVRMGTVLAWMDYERQQATRLLTAQVAALTATVAAMAKNGGLTAEQAAAAAEAGAKAALAELGDALKR